jgi:hypothetical protein
MKLLTTNFKIKQNLIGALIGLGMLGFVFTPDARADGWALGVDIPMQFAYTGDIKGTARPAGFIASLDLPFHVGVGSESYSVEAEDSSGIVTFNIDYNFTDFYVWYNFQVMSVAFGGGRGTAQIPEFDDGTGSLISTDEADADQVFLRLGWFLNQNWEFHVAYHQIDAVANVLVAGVADGTTVDLRGVMSTAGFKFMF